MNDKTKKSTTVPIRKETQMELKSRAALADKSIVDYLDEIIKEYWSHENGKSNSRKRKPSKKN